MTKVWDEDAWEDYIYRKPEPLKGDLSGFWSREIDKKNRLVYRIVERELQIIQCKTHYGGK